MEPTSLERLDMDGTSGRIRGTVVKFMMSLWLMKHVKLLLVGLQLHSLPTIRKPLKSFRMWWITLIHGNMWINKTLL